MVRIPTSFASCPIAHSLLEIDRNRASTRKTGTLGGSLFPEANLSAPRLQPLATAQSSLSKAEMKATASLSTYASAYTKTSNGNSSNTSLAVKAAQLSSLLQTLAEAEGSVAESLKARRTLIECLEKLLNENKSTLGQDESQLTDLATKRTSLETERRSIEDKILRGDGTTTNSDEFEPPRPEAEPLTPPPQVESLTPVGSPKGLGGFDAPPDLAASTGFAARPRPADSSFDARPAVKRRRIHENPIDEFAGFEESDAFGGIDPDVAALLAKE
jgi:regulator of Ty1 transposition protein 103